MDLGKKSVDYSSGGFDPDSHPEYFIISEHCEIGIFITFFE